MEPREEGDRRCPPGFDRDSLLDDAAARAVRQGVGGDALLPVGVLLLPRHVPVPLLARQPAAPGLLVFQRVVPRPLPETLEEPFLLRRVAALGRWNRKVHKIIITCRLLSLFVTTR